MNLTYILERPGDLMKKVERDEKHLRKALNGQEQEQISDAIFNFAVTAYYIKDWLKKEPSVEAAQINVEDYVNQNIVLCVCGDLCNSSKHRYLDNKQRSSAKNIGDSPLTVDMTTITVAIAILCKLQINSTFILR